MHLKWYQIFALDSDVDEVHEIFDDNRPEKEMIGSYACASVIVQLLYSEPHGHFSFLLVLSRKIIEHSQDLSRDM